jgi:hypothetical protein
MLWTLSRATELRMANVLEDVEIPVKCPLADRYRGRFLIEYVSIA